MKLLTILLLVIMLTGCDGLRSFNPDGTQRIDTIRVYPNLPPVEINEPTLHVWKHDVPRDLNGKLEVKNTTACKNVAENNRDDEFWKRCGEYPMIPNTNVFVGFDQDNWNIILEDFLKLKATLGEYRARLNEVNAQREDWRKKNQEQIIEKTK